jgi:hypothetical protein
VSKLFVKLGNQEKNKLLDELDFQVVHFEKMVDFEFMNSKVFTFLKNKKF